jgi:branched-chain amino acid transport system substrate-binding protein
MHRARAGAVSLLAALCASALIEAVVVPAGATQQFPAVDQPGVSAKEIRVGGVADVTQNPTGVSYGPAFDGVRAYFAYINKTRGGVFGRRLVLASERDDQLSNNRQEVEGLLSQDDVFAALPMATTLFTGAQLLEDAGIPVFGWDIQDEWGSENNTPGPPNFFAAGGSFLCFTCGLPDYTHYLARKLGAKRIGVLAYSVAQSAACAEGLNKGFKKFPTAKVVFDDESLAFGTPDYSAQVSQMVDKGVQLVIPCIDFNGAVTLKREMLKQGLDAPMLLPNAYNFDAVAKNAQFLDGSYLRTLFAPLETRPKPEGVKRFEHWMKKTGGKVTENSIVGWINADQFVSGLEAAGPSFTRRKVIDAINKMTDYTADGFLPPVNWTVAHEQRNPCGAVLKIVDGKFRPVFGKPGKPFICFPDTLKKIPKNPTVV